MQTRIFPGNLNLDMDLDMKENMFLAAARLMDQWRNYRREAKQMAAKKKQMDVVIKRGMDVNGKEREKWMALYMCKHYSYCN